MLASPQIDLKVIGVEMVHIPEGAFEAGGVASNISSARPLNNGVDGSPLSITSEAAINIQWTNGSNHVQNQMNVPAAYPKGFNGFYIMKYEVTEGLYATFLNTIPPTMADRGGFAGNVNQCYPDNYTNNHNLLNENGTAPNTYVAKRPHRAQNYLTHRDLFALLDWMALRPISELEYEKSCRGINPAVGDEYAWGTTNFVEGRTINLNPEDGTEIILEVDANANYQNNNFNGGDLGANQRGPLRVGVFAEVGDSTRAQTGASYYGVMEMSGNLAETTISIVDIQAGTIYDGSYGDGYLETSNIYNVPNWPLTGGETKVMFRGAGWSNYNKSSWHTFTTDNHIDYFRAQVRETPFGSGTTWKYSLFEGDASSNPTGLTPIDTCVDFTQGSSTSFPNGPSVFYECLLEPNTTYSMQLLYDKDYKSAPNDVEVGIYELGRTTTASPDPLNITTNGYNIEVLPTGTTDRIDIFACNAQMKFFSAALGRPASMDFITCSAGSELTDPENIIHEDVHNLTSNSTDGLFYNLPRAIDPRRNLWYTFTARGGGRIIVTVHKRTSEVGGNDPCTNIFGCNNDRDYKSRNANFAVYINDDLVLLW